jgi:hypothetical protein
MTAKAWKTNIVKQMKAVGTYQAAFGAAIQATADLLEQRDRVYEQYVNEGSQAMVVRVLDRGGKNTVENPLLKTWRELQAQSLKNWQELGLTPASLKKINESAVKPAVKETSPLAKALAKYG